MSGWVKDLIDAAVNAALDTLTSATMAALNWVLSLLAGDIFHSPDLTSLPQVVYVSGRAQWAANACMTLIVVVVGLIAMTHGTLQDRHSLKDLLPRMVIVFAAANMAGPIVRGVVAGANAVTEGLAGGGFTSQDSFTAIRRTLVDAATDPSQFIVALVLQQMALWMLVFVVTTWLGRLSVLLVVAATGPAALMCHAIPFAEPVARLWWRALTSVLAVQILQAVTLHMAVATMLVGGASLPALGLPNDPTGLLNMLVACFLLWLVIRIPKWVARNVGGPTSGAGSRLGSVVRLIVVQQLLRAVGLRGARRPGRRPAAGRPRPPGPRTYQHTAHQHLHVHPPGRTPGGRPAGPYRAGTVGRTAGSYPGRPQAGGRQLPPAAPPRRAIGPGPS